MLSTFVPYEYSGTYQTYNLFSCCNILSAYTSSRLSFSMYIACSACGMFTLNSLTPRTCVVLGTPDRCAHFLASMTMLMRDERSGSLMVVRLSTWLVTVCTSSKLSRMVSLSVDPYTSGFRTVRKLPSHSKRFYSE